MKKRILSIGLLFLIVINVIGCAGNKATKDKPSEEELARAEIVCGVVRSVDKENIRIQLCGNLFWDYVGAGYVNVENEYVTLKEGDCVLLYYTGTLKCEEKETYADLYDMEVCYVEKAENDGKFIADMSLGGSIYPEGITKTEAERILVPIKGEPEENFRVVISTTDLTSNETVWSDIIYEVEDWQKEVTVTYDIETMEILSITQ